MQFVASPSGAAFIFPTSSFLITAARLDNEIQICYTYSNGVVTDSNGFLYMRARYYAPELCRFINADIIPGEISNAITLNRFAYANGNPVSNIDPFGLSADNRTESSSEDGVIPEVGCSDDGNGFWDTNDNNPSL